MAFYNFIQRETDQPGSVSCLASYLSCLALLIVALAGNANKSGALTAVYMAGVDASNADWDHVLLTTDVKIDSDWKDGNFAQRYSLWNTCVGRKDDEDFISDTCGRSARDSTLSPKHFIAKELSKYTQDEEIDPDNIRLFDHAEIKQGVSGVANAFLIMAVVLIGVGIILTIFVPGQYLIIMKITSLSALFISNVVSHASVRRMVHAFNDHESQYGISADFGDKYYGMIWAAFATLVTGITIEFCAPYYYQWYYSKRRANERKDSETTLNTEINDYERKTNSMV